MAFTTDNSANFPHVFEVCGACGRKGVFEIRPTLVGGVPQGHAVSCRYCKRHKRLDGSTFLGLAKEAELIGYE